MNRNVLAPAIALCAVASPAIADPISLTAIVATSLGGAVSTALAGAGVATALAPMAGSMIDAVFPSEPARQVPTIPADLKILGMGPHLQVEAKFEGGVPFIARLLTIHERWGETLAAAYLRRVAIRDAKRVRAAEKHAPAGVAFGLACHGDCLGNLTDEGDVMFYDHRDIAPGDLSTFTIRDEPPGLKRTKFYLGSIPACDLTAKLYGDLPGRFMCWAQTNPAMMLIAPERDVEGHVRASHLWHRDVLHRLGPIENERNLGDLRALWSEVRANSAPATELPYDVNEGMRELLGDGS